MKLLDGREPDSVTVQQLSIERIAREAGVSKTTIYRWWTNKAAVIIDTFLESHILSTPVREDLPAIDALREHAVALASLYSGHEGRLMAQLIAESQYDPATLDEFKRHFWQPRRDAVGRVIARGQAEGSIRTGIEASLLADAIYAPIYFRLLFQEGELTPEAIRAQLNVIFDGIATPQDAAQVAH